MSSNQCDGCAQELLLAFGTHYEVAGYERIFNSDKKILRLCPVQACQADKYSSEWDFKFQSVNVPDEAAASR